MPARPCRRRSRWRRTLQSKGFDLTLDYLGESVRTHQEADAAAREYVQLIDVLVASGIERNISLKLTQLGAGVDRATCIDNLRRILEAAERHAFFVRIDMESSAYTDLTLDVFETLWTRGHHNLGVAIQAALKRSEADVARVNALGGRIRLVKGAYKEPPDIAYARKADVDAAFVRLMKMLLDSGQYPAIATHDPEMIDATLAHAEARKLPPSRYEFQMLYGVRRDLPAGARRRRLPGARLRALRPGVVPLLHAAPRRAAGECSVCHSCHAARSRQQLNAPRLRLQAHLQPMVGLDGDYWFAFRRPLVNTRICTRSHLATRHRLKDWRDTGLRDRHRNDRVSGRDDGFETPAHARH